MFDNVNSSRQGTFKRNVKLEKLAFLKMNKAELDKVSRCAKI